ncbi:MAG TPA: AAC(3) family N-acetyltransferase [Patescibacteria group bacterium]|nr:AAC(3) family N-acetyltransferase [Patescibacteria group bacterium]
MRPVTRRLQSLNSRVFKRVAREEIRDGLARLGLSAGDTVYANVSMRRLGYVPGGAGDVVAAIMDVISPEGTLVMAAWPMADPTRIAAGELFDIGETPSRAGLLSEALRTYPEARRSLHPISSVVAVGSRAAELTAGHDLSARPFGQASPYGKLAKLSPRLLLIGAHIGGLLYHVQDQVGYPNLYTDELTSFEIRDAKGMYRTMNTHVLCSGVPPVVILPGSRPENRDFMLMPDYALMFPAEREQAIMEAGYLRFNRSRFLGRRERLQARGILKQGRVGSADAALLDGARMLEQIAKDLAWDLARYKEEYDPEQLALLSLPVL